MSNSLTTIKLSNPYNLGFNRLRGLSEDSFKEQLRNFGINPLQKYFFLQTKASSKALEVIAQKSTHIRLFGTSLMELYINSLKEILKEKKIKHMSYDLVNRECHSQDVDSDYPKWPIIHLLEGENSPIKFEESLKELNNDKSYLRISKKEAPQNYRMGSINLLRAKNISPLEITGDKWSVSGKELINAANFLIRPTFVDKYDGPIMNMD